MMFTLIVIVDGATTGVDVGCIAPSDACTLIGITAKDATMHKARTIAKCLFMNHHFSI